jgi:succinylarginine dihydrolase
MAAYEVNFDGLVGPTHNYAGLSYGNVASTRNKNMVANPKLAALQGLEKMKSLADMGFKQGVLPPHDRPSIDTLRQLGFKGHDERIIAKVATLDPHLLVQLSSASAMWVANAATVSPSVDTKDGKVHFTAANLLNKFHRSFEHPQTSRTLNAIFQNPDIFCHHPALPMHQSLGDEGAANHNRLSKAHGSAGVEIFVYGQHYYSTRSKPSVFPARHTREASQAVARLHGLSDDQCEFLQQNASVIDQGVFHNDVIAVSNGSVFFHHQEAFIDTKAAFSQIKQKLAALECEFNPIEVPSYLVSVKDAIDTYLFNSQLLTKNDGKMLLVVPSEVTQHPGVWRYLTDLVDHHSIVNEIKVFDLRESMRNGGGPACLRLRVVLQNNELEAINQNTLMSSRTYGQLVAWVEKHYRDRLSEKDLADPNLLLESRTALDELTQLMSLGSIYPFQRG